MGLTNFAFLDHQGSSDVKKVCADWQSHKVAKTMGPNTRSFITEELRRTTQMSCEFTALEYDVILNEMEHFEFHAGETVFEEGSSACYFFVIERGSISGALKAQTVFSWQPTTSGDQSINKINGSNVHPNNLTYFNTCLFYGKPWNSSGIATEKCELWALRGDFVRNIVKNALKRNNSELVSAMNLLWQAQEFNREQKELVASASYLHDFPVGHAILSEDVRFGLGPGAAPAGRRFIVRGEVSVLGGGAMGEGDCCFSGAMLDSGSRCRCSMRAASECRVIHIDYNELASVGAWDLIGCLEMKFKMRMRDLQMMNCVGQGKFGTVRLTMDPRTRIKYALKHIRKDDKNSQQDAARECALLAEINDPFVQQFITTFKSASSMYILTEYLPGGDLFDAMRQFIGTLPLRAARFYIGSVVIGLHALHSRNIAHRDLKPENVMLDGTGYVKLVDLGTSKKFESSESRTFTIIGTPAYMAPEMTREKGYTCSVDYWSLGIILYELVCGYMPFAAKETDPIKIFKAVRKCELKFPSGYTCQSGRSLMQNLLCKDQGSRLGALETSAHEFFHDEDMGGNIFPALLNRSYTAPYVPAADGCVQGTNVTEHGEISKY